MKILVLGDIHGRPVWKNIIEKENPDKVIFLGDFVATHERNTPEQQIEQLEAILDYKDEHPNTVILRGNHDLDGLGYYWASCWPRPDAYVCERMNRNAPLGQRFLKASQWFKRELIGDKKVIFSHAGITREWLTDVHKLKIGTKKQLEAALNKIALMEPSESFGFTGGRWDSGGTDPCQSCTWVRPYTLREHAIPGYTQVVGHTPTHHKCQSMSILVQKGEIWEESEDLIWRCDELGTKSYLVIEDNNFIPKSL